MRISGPQARPLTHLERPKPQVMGADKEAKRPAGCTLDDRGRLAPFPPGREGRGDGWRARNAPSLLELLLLPKSKTNLACNALQGPQTKTLPLPLAYLLNASPAVCALRCRLFWARWWCHPARLAALQQRVMAAGHPFIGRGSRPKVGGTPKGCPGRRPLTAFRFAQVVELSTTADVLRF